MAVNAVKADLAQLRMAQAEQRRERARKRLVRWIFVVYWLLIFEGVLRKWVLPQFSNELFFVRDPFVLLIYVLALKNGFWPRMQGFMLFTFFLAVIVAVLVAGQLADPSSFTNGLLAAYGWRNYFLYIPLAFIIGSLFRREDIARLVRHTLVLSVPIAVLVTVQFFSPGFSWINVQSFDGLMGRIRPAGTFSSVAGQALMAASLTALVLPAWIARPRDRMVGRILLYLGTGALLVCIAVSGSRAVMVHSALILLSGMFAGFVMRGGSKVRAWTLPAAIVILGAILYPILLPDAYEATMLRWQMAHATESQHFSLGVIGRAFYGFVLFLSYIPVTPLMGFGMGIGGNASRMMDEVRLPIRAEDEWSRQIVDLGPIFGILYIVFRISLFVVLGLRALRATRKTGDALPMILFGFVGIVLLNGQVTGNGIINGYCWMFVGLLLAAINLSKTPKEAAVK